MENVIENDIISKSINKSINLNDLAIQNVYNLLLTEFSHMALSTPLLNTIFVHLSKNPCFS